MIDWALAFTCPRALAPERIADALAAFTGAPVTTSRGELDGNPRDYYWQSISIAGRRGDVTLSISVTQNLMMPSDPDPITDINGVRFTTPTVSFPLMREIWMGLSAALGAIGCTDVTLERPQAAVFVARMEDADEDGLAVELRAEITAALVAKAPGEVHVYLTSMRGDLDAVLAAYPETITRVFLEDCRFRALPEGLRRFAGLELLQITEQEIDGNILRDWSLPRLAWLSLRSSSVRTLTREDVAGLPALRDLGLYRSRIRRLDADIIEVCPNLDRLAIADTPLGRDAEAVAALRARWPKVTWDV